MIIKISHKIIFIYYIFNIKFKYIKTLFKYLFYFIDIERLF